MRAPAAARQVETHYETLLAPIYSWMAGGLSAASAAAEDDLAGLAGKPGLAVDLGAGLGLHAAALARAGYRVVAVESSRRMAAQLRATVRGLSVSVVVADLTRFVERLPRGRKADLILCMGDTLMHLPDESAVARLARSARACLAPGGRLVATFRNYARLPAGPARFILVRGDRRRVLTCFLERRGGKVLVHDVLHERRAGGWTIRVGGYEKLRLSPGRVRRVFESAGLKTSLKAGPRGMLRLEAARP